jgi:GT2 family glycosyltransferase
MPLKTIAPVCIAGMHRSGTSMVAHLLHDCGLYLGPVSDLGKPGPDNQDGFWENAHFVKINEALLTHLESGWDSPPAEASGWERRPELLALRGQAAQLLQAMNAHDWWGWKDPRNSLTLPFWKNLLPDLKVVICLRHPLDVAASLHRRGYSSMLFGLKLWLAYNERLLTLLPPEARIVTHYSAYFYDPLAELRRVVNRLGQEVEAETLAQAITRRQPTLRHHQARLTELLTPEIPEAVVQCYLALCAEAGPVYQMALQAELAAAPPPAPTETALKPEYRQSLRLWRLEAQLAEKDRALQTLNAQISDQAQSLRTLNTRLTETERAAQALSTQVVEQAQVVHALNAQLIERQNTMEGLSAQLAEQNARVATLTDQLTERDNTARQLAAQVAGQMQALEKIHRSKHWRLMSVYWRTRWHMNQAVRRPYQAFRQLLRVIIPYEIRRQAVLFWRSNRRARRQPSDSTATSSGTDGSMPGAQVRSNKVDDPPPSARPHTFPPAKTYDVICFPIIDWEFRFQRPQQLLTQFARHGHRGFYLSTAFHQAGPSVLANEIAPNLYGLQLPGPRLLNVYNHSLDEKTLAGCLEALNEFRRQAGLVEVVCLVQLPFWVSLALAARERWGWKVVYDCIDEHSGFSTYRAATQQDEEQLIAQSDLVVATAHRLHEKIQPVARRTALVPNAADYGHFSLARDENPLTHLPRPIIGYYGAISDWFDVAMVHAAALARPAWQFVLIGHTFGADVSGLQALPNVHLLGEKPYATLPNYLHQFNVACIPFKLTPLTLATNPVKFYEYLSAGKPVVAVELPELEPFREYFYPVRNAADFVPQIERALQETPSMTVGPRQRLARENTWPARYRALHTAIMATYGKTAIVIVSYNNLNYLRLCLESLWSKTLYPNFEVVVVDNGSDPDVIEYLQASAATEPRLKVVLNGANLGFPRANNIGIEVAGPCDFTVLLNNDTIVTRGWLTRMVGYLSNPEIGLIGPVTNWAGNEARIEVDYQDPSGLEPFAERYGRERSGRIFDISVLAMYCVGMRSEILSRVGLLDERFNVGMFEDDDFSLRVRRAGYRVVCAEDIFIHHWGRASFGKLNQARYTQIFEDNRRKFEEKWGQSWQPHQARAR